MDLFRFLVTAVFGTAGTVLGAIGGFFSGMIDGDGMMQGTLNGANNGALLSVDYADLVLRICYCEDYYVVAQNRGTQLSLAADNIGSALDNHIEALLGRSGRELQPSYQVLAARRATIHSLPQTELTEETTGHHSTCIICLSEFQAGEIARSLPACNHVFHMACIDSWFRRKSVCPICRHPVY
uniref:RING-type domain-containing protein n=1 Tax=Hordeum vulgare subsp. vulgare TaxID=112509 RepID=A0A8I6YND4_HORVV